MSILQVVSQAECASVRSRHVSFLIVALSCVFAPAVDHNSSQETPLERAGLKPAFRENFTDGNLDAMRYAPAYGSREQFNAYIQPGAIFLGQENATEITEQQIIYYPKSNEPAFLTIEFDVCPPHCRNREFSFVRGASATAFM